MTRFQEWKITTKAVLAAAVVSAAVAAGVAGGRGTVEVHQTSASAPVDETTTTTTVPAPETTTTSQPSATTTPTAAPPVEQRVIVVEKRVTEVEDRVTKLESTTTTTTRPTPQVRLVDNAIGLADGPGTWTNDFGRLLDFESTMPMPGLKVTFKHWVTGDNGLEIREFTAAFEEGQTKVTYLLPPELVKATGHLEDIYQGIVSVTWDGKR